MLKDGYIKLTPPQPRRPAGSGGLLPTLRSGRRGRSVSFGRATHNAGV